MNADRKRLSLERRDELEYLAAFMNPEAVSKIFKDRQHKESLAANPELDKIFADQVEKQFGHVPSILRPKTSDVDTNRPIPPIGKK